MYRLLGRLRITKEIRNEISSLWSAHDRLKYQIQSDKRSYDKRLSSQVIFNWLVILNFAVMLFLSLIIFNKCRRG